MFGEVFVRELLRIKDREWREVVVALGQGTPEYLYKIPSSSTGKYHPADEIATGGQIMHIRRVWVCADEAGRLNKLVDDDQDILYAGALLHDMFKNGLAFSKYTVKKHPVLIYRHIMEAIEEFKKDPKAFDEPEILYTKLRKLAYICLLHEGQWTIPASQKIADEDFSVEEMAEYKDLADSMHWADYWASRRTVSDSMQKGAVKGVEKKEAAAG